MNMHVCGSGGSEAQCSVRCIRAIDCNKVKNMLMKSSTQVGGPRAWLAQECVFILFVPFMASLAWSSCPDKRSVVRDRGS